MSKEEWINSTIARYCKETGDLPRSTSHMSTLEQWLMRQLWEVEKAKATMPEPELPTRTVFIDPDEGWRYGFPKAFTFTGKFPDADEINAWLIENGYPKEIIDKHGGVSIGISGKID